MCCPLDRIQSTLVPQAIAVEHRNGQDVYHIRAFVDRSPQNTGDYVLRIFQRLDLVEKIAEVVDESFHLLSSQLRMYLPSSIFDLLRNIHHIAHDIEHLMHALCFFGDLSRLATGRFVEYTDLTHTQISYLRTLARIAHLASHALSTAIYLSENNICRFTRLEKWFAYAPLFSALGFSLWATSLVWNRYYRQLDNPQLASDLGIHVGGCVFQAIPFMETMKYVSEESPWLKKVAALAGIIHAWCFIQRLTPPDREALAGEWIMPDALHVAPANPAAPVHDDHDHDDEHLDGHGPHLHFVPILVT